MSTNQNFDFLQTGHCGNQGSYQKIVDELNSIYFGNWISKLNDNSVAQIKWQKNVYLILLFEKNKI